MGDLASEPSGVFALEGRWKGKEDGGRPCTFEFASDRMLLVEWADQPPLRRGLVGRQGAAAVHVPFGGGHALGGAAWNRRFGGGVGRDSSRGAVKYTATLADAVTLKLIPQEGPALVLTSESVHPPADDDGADGEGLGLALVGTGLQLNSKLLQ
eukprot:TRINITY_DN2338_c0_g1_i5.p2 TRINITY_DN2338_c0_g1~~TRINITY_DN2338_c0_g1_i5.p2  ORF type:complete len:171 (+),score=34.90 TRINITY_DN2338_c0_g1_i5:52-513(+)